MTSKHTEMTDIRAWLRENRPDLGVQPKGKVPEAAVKVYREVHGDETPPEEVTAPSLQDEAERSPEVAPVPEKKAWWQKAAPRAKPKPVHRRTPIDTVMAGAWRGLAFMASQNPQTIPVGRCLALQAPAAGMVLDDVLKGTMLDKMVQPLARTSKSGETVWALLGPPLLTGLITSKPELYPVLRPMLREAVGSWVLLAGPKMRKAEERKQKLLSELGGDMETIDAMIDALFAAPEGMEVPDAADYAPAGA